MNPSKSKTMKPQTEVDERGLRKFCRDGHPIAWLAPDLKADGQVRSYSAPKGRCTSGDWWSQDGAARLQAVWQPRWQPRRGGFYYFRCDIRPDRSWKVARKLECAAKHVTQTYHDYVIDPGEETEVDSVARMAIDQEQWERIGWRFTWRKGTERVRGPDWSLDVWCPACVQEWHAFEAETEKLRSEVGAS